MSKRVTKELDFIKKFQKITLTKIVKDLNINKANLYCGNTTNLNEKRVVDEIIKRVFEIIKEYEVVNE